MSEKQPASSALHLVDPLNGKEGTVFDKPAPTGPPTPLLREIPPHLGKVIQFFGGIIADESLLLDLCLDRAMEVVEFNCKKRRTGGDGFLDGGSITPEGLVQLAAPLAVELYRETLKSVVERKDEYAALLSEAQKELERGAKPASQIFVP